MPLFWKPQLAVGHDVIDQDHRYLVLLINTVELVLKVPGNRHYILDAFDALHEYAKEHFDREERLQIAARYPYYDRHKLEHQLLLQKLADLRSRVEMDLLGDDADSVIAEKDGDEIIGFLKSWLVDHVVGQDLKMRQFLAPQKFVR